MSKSQLNAFMVKVDADSALKARVVAADADAVVAIALEHGHVFPRPPGLGHSGADFSCSLTSVGHRIDAFEGGAQQ